MKKLIYITLLLIPFISKQNHEQRSHKDSKHLNEKTTNKPMKSSYPSLDWATIVSTGYRNLPGDKALAHELRKEAKQLEFEHAPASYRTTLDY